MSSRLNGTLVLFNFKLMGKMRYHLILSHQFKIEQFIMRLGA